MNGTSTKGTTAYLYDAAGRTTNIKHTTGTGTVLGHYTYVYDNADRVTSKVENGTTTNFGYDTASQLTSDGATGYSYDGTGNRTNTGYVTGAGNRTTSDGTWTYTYDAEGNVTKRSKGASSDTWVYIYDHRNQLVSSAYSATDGGAVTQRVTNSYDAWGNKLQRAAWDGSTTTTERYAVDGWDPAKDWAIGIENFDTWADLNGSNAITMRRGYGPGFDELAWRQTSGGAAGWYLTDRLGSVRGVTSGTGTPLTTLTYSGWGAVLSNSTPAQSDAYQFTGRPVDSVTGLRDHHVRVTPGAQWMQEDPLGLIPDANPRRYVGNGPTNYKDPSGFAAAGLDSGPGQQSGSPGGLPAQPPVQQNTGWFQTPGPIGNDGKPTAGCYIQPWYGLLDAERGEAAPPVFIGYLIRINGELYVARYDGKQWIALPWKELENQGKLDKPGVQQLLNPGKNPGAIVLSEPGKNPGLPQATSRPPSPPGTSSSRLPGPENELLNQIFGSGRPTTSGSLGTNNGENYSEAGQGAATVIIGMFVHISEQALVNTLASLGPGKAVQFIGFLEKKGYKLLTSRSGAHLGAMTKEGRVLTKDEIQALEKEFIAASKVKTGGIPTSGKLNAPNAPGAATRESLLGDLAKGGVKHSPDKVVVIGRDASGKVVFLEQGNAKAGLQHIVDAHGADFARRGIPVEQIPDAVLAAATRGKPVGMQGTRPIYEVEINGQTHRIAVTVGDNGFIVGANPAGK